MPKMMGVTWDVEAIARASFRFIHRFLMSSSCREACGGPNRLSVISISNTGYVLQ